MLTDELTGTCVPHHCQSKDTIIISFGNSLLRSAHQKRQAERPQVDDDTERADHEESEDAANPPVLPPRVHVCYDGG